MNTLIFSCWTPEDSPFLENADQLYTLLRAVYPDVEDTDIKVSQTIPESIIQQRGGSGEIYVDAWVESKNLVVYVNTIEDYRDPRRIVERDTLKEVLSGIGYTVVSIPFFIQMDTATIKHYFDVELDACCDTPTGFPYDVEANPYVPASFCSLGWNRFISDTYSLPEEIGKQVFGSLKAHYQEFGHDMTMIAFPLGLECNTCPAGKAKETIEQAWKNSVCMCTAGPQ